MSDLERRFHEDRALRDAAWTVLMADVEHARGSFSVNGLTGRVGERIGDGAKDVFEVAKTRADDNRGIIAVLIGAILLWMGREPLLDLIGLGEEDEREDQIESRGVQENENDIAQTQPDEGDAALDENRSPGDYHEQ